MHAITAAQSSHVVSFLKSFCAFLESFHSVFKKEYLIRRPRRMDDLINLLMLYEQVLGLEARWCPANYGG